MGTWAQENKRHWKDNKFFLKSGITVEFFFSCLCLYNIKTESFSLVYSSVSDFHSIKKITF